MIKKRIIPDKSIDPVANFIDNLFKSAAPFCGLSPTAIKLLLTYLDNEYFFSNLVDLPYLDCEKLLSRVSEINSVDKLYVWFEILSTEYKNGLNSPATFTKEEYCATLKSARLFQNRIIIAKESFNELMRFVRIPEGEKTLTLSSDTIMALASWTPKKDLPVSSKKSLSSIKTLAIKKLYNFLCKFYKETLLKSFPRAEFSFIPENWLKERTLSEILRLKEAILTDICAIEKQSDRFFPLYILARYFIENSKDKNTMAKKDKLFQLIEQDLLTKINPENFILTKNDIPFLGLILNGSLHKNSKLLDALANPVALKKLNDLTSGDPEYVRLALPILYHIMYHPEKGHEVLPIIKDGLLQVLQTFHKDNKISHPSTYLCTVLIHRLLEPRGIGLSKDDGKMIGDTLITLESEMAKHAIPTNGRPPSDTASQEEQDRYDDKYFKYMMEISLNPKNFRLQSQLIYHGLSKIIKLLSLTNSTPPDINRITDIQKNLLKKAFEYSDKKKIFPLHVLSPTKELFQGSLTLENIIKNPNKSVYYLINAQLDLNPSKTGNIITSLFQIFKGHNNEKEVLAIISKIIKTKLIKNIREEWSQTSIKTLINSPETPKELRNTLSNALEKIIHKKPEPQKPVASPVVKPDRKPSPQMKDGIYLNIVKLLNDTSPISESKEIIYSPINLRKSGVKTILASRLNILEGIAKIIDLASNLESLEICLLYLPENQFPDIQSKVQQRIDDLKLLRDEIRNTKQLLECILNDEKKTKKSQQ